jgi:glycosyltransferase involved in cell wall biosynthesis
MKRIRILYTIPNFDTAGSGLALLKIANSLDPKYFEPIIACLHDRGDLFKSVKKSGIKIYIFDIYKKHRPILNMLIECYSLSKVFKEINPDIIHSYNYASDYTEPLAAKIARIKWIYTKKNMSWLGPSYRAWKLRSWLADGIICQNKEMLKSFFPNWNKATLLPIGVDSKEYKSQIEDESLQKFYGILDSDRILITIANLVPVKGIEVLLEAFKKLTLDYTNCKLMIVGNNQTRYGDKLKLDVDQLKLNDKVIFTGKVDNVNKLLDLAELYIQPTLNKGEGAPIAIQEAMSNGKVVIGSNVPGIRDQLENFPNQLFKPGDCIALYKKLVFFISRKIEDNIELGKKHISFVKKNYDISIEKQKLQKYYKMLLE